MAGDDLYGSMRIWTPTSLTNTSLH